MTTEATAELAARLGITVSDSSLLDLARVHPSYTPEHGVPSNQRLEFLGDAVVGLVVAEALFVAHPDLDEGAMSKARIALVNETVLADVARDVRLGEFLLLGKGAARAGEADLDSVLADAFEAVVGAIYLSEGLETARGLVLRLLGERLESAARAPGSGDFKSMLNEWAQATYGQMATYEVVQSGPEHAPTFLATLRIGDRLLATGEGRSKKQAEAAAAKAALEEVRSA